MLVVIISCNNKLVILIEVMVYSAVPNCVCGDCPMCCLLSLVARRSLVNLADMMEAVVFLKALKTRGLVMELSRGVWLRSPERTTGESSDIHISFT